ncbi:MAG: hypothetical protein J3R72DRAFT_257899 [Linnemannia gamsii]|nr:MAG: hypothetical protein J3R72DRAFT_257899 [Linnemannia gamsii]
MLTPFLLPHQLGASTWLWGTLCLLKATMVSAQLSQAQPFPVTSVAYATFDEKTFYVNGGWGQMAAVPQFYSLDLTQDNWKVSSPPWRQLNYPSDIQAEYDHSMTVSLDGRTIALWVGKVTQLVNYSITDNKWTQSPSGFVSQGTHAATDPTTGTVYILNGTTSISWVNYNIASGFSTEPLPTSLFNLQDTIISFVWSKVRKSFIVHTSEEKSATNPLFEYIPSSGQWKALSTTGSIPPNRSNFCVVPAYEGTKMILFGGSNPTASKIFGDIHILDVPSMKWTKGKSAPIARSDMACTVAGDNFIVWAGTNNVFPEQTSPAPGPPLIYDINSNQWVQQYTRRSSYKSSSAPSPSPTNGLAPPGDTGEGNIGGVGGDSSGANGAAIGGGVAGAIVVITAIAFLVVRKLRQSRGQHNNSKHSDVPYHDQGSLRTEDANIAPSTNVHSKWNRRQLTPNSPQFIGNDPQSLPDSSQSTTSSPLASSSTIASPSPVIPPSSKPFQSIDRQTRIRSMDQQLLVIQEQIGAQGNNPHFIRNDPQSTPNSPESTASSPLGPSYSTLASPVIPPCPSKPFKSTDRQNRVRSMDQHLLVIQEQVGAHRNNPQYDPTVNGTLSPSTVRGPQGGGKAEPASGTSTQELRYQMQSIQAELDRRDAI